MVAVEDFWTNVSRAAAATTAAAATASEFIIQEVSSDEVWSDLAFCHDCVVVPCTAGNGEKIPKIIAFQPKTKLLTDVSDEHKRDLECDNDTVSDFGSLLFCTSNSTCGRDSISEILNAGPPPAGSLSHLAVSTKIQRNRSTSLGSATDMCQAPLLELDEGEEKSWEDHTFVRQELVINPYEMPVPYDEQANIRYHMKVANHDRKPFYKIDTTASF